MIKTILTKEQQNKIIEGFVERRKNVDYYEAEMNDNAAEQSSWAEDQRDLDDDDEQDVALHLEAKRALSNYHDGVAACIGNDEAWELRKLAIAKIDETK